MTYVPVAVNDSDLGNTIGDDVTIDVLGNDTGAFVVASVRILDGATPVTQLLVAGQGTWSVDTSNGEITFAPLAGFEGDPTPISYRVTDVSGDNVSATVTVAYVPVAVDDGSHGNTQGTTVVVDVLGNDTGDFVASSVRIEDGASLVTGLVVAGEGTWTVDPATGALTFGPVAGYLGNPTPITYRVTDSTGDTVSAEVIVTYLPEASDDINKGNVAGAAVSVDVVGNDDGIFDAASVRLIDPANGQRVMSLRVAGQGLWTVNAQTGVITFTPDAGFLGNPTPVSYEITDVNGNVTTAQVVITYLPAALQTTGGDVLPVALLGGSLLLLGAGAAAYAGIRRRSLASR